MARSLCASITLTRTVYLYIFRYIQNGHTSYFVLVCMIDEVGGPVFAMRCPHKKKKILFFLPISIHKKYSRDGVSYKKYLLLRRGGGNGACCYTGW